jgi:PTH1 family peptidyl-tRNA hydrolase
MSRFLRSLFPRDAGVVSAPPDIPRLIVGLGNPGAEYAGTRHNVGYWVVNRLARKHGLDFRVRTGTYFLAEGAIGGRQIALAKPRTFVNASGEAVNALIRRLRLDGPHDLLVVCDDLDMTVGRLRLRAKGGHGGQKGLMSVVQAIGTDAFPRVRIGIGRPVVGGKPSWDPEDVAAYVLSDPPPEEKAALDAAVATAVEAIETLLAEGIEAAMARFNR